MDTGLDATLGDSSDGMEYLFGHYLLPFVFVDYHLVSSCDRVL